MKNSAHNFVTQVAKVIQNKEIEDKIAFIENGQTITYSELLTNAAQVAASLKKRGVQPGQRVTLVMSEGIDFVVTFLGILHLGAVAMPVNAWLGEKAVAQAIEVAESSMTVVSRSKVLDIDRSVDVENLLYTDGDAPSVPEAVDRQDFAIGLFTSGTTGSSKICFHTHADIAVLNHGAGNAIGIKSNDICMSASGLHFSYGLGNLVFFPLLRGATSVLSGLDRRMTQKEALTQIELHKVTVFSAIPSYYLRFTKTLHERDTSSLRIVVTGGEVLGRSLEKELVETFGDGRLVNVFGSTEVGHAIVVNSSETYVSGTTGRVVDGYNVRVVDTLRNPCPAGIVGALEVLGSTITGGVLRGSETPRRMINEWYAMGDAARIDEDGIVTVLGRFEDIETLEGESVYPAEVESEFVALDEVSEAAVFVAEVNGRPSLLALLVLNNSRTEEAVNLTAIHEIITRRLRSKPAPNIIYVVPELPHLSGGGKLARNFIKRNWKELVTSLYPNFNRTKAGTKAMPHKRPAETDSYRLTKGGDTYAS